MVGLYQNQRGGHTKNTAIDTSRKKLTLVIWTPKLEGFACNTSAENVTSQRRKESKNITRVEEKKIRSKHYYTARSASASYSMEQELS